MKTLMLPLVCLLVSLAASYAQTSAADSLNVYAGTYSFASGSPVNTFVVTVDQGNLYGEVDGNGKNKLLKQAAADTFKSTSSYGSIITFLRDATTKVVTGFTLAAQGMELSAKKEKP